MSGFFSQKASPAFRGITQGLGAVSEGVGTISSISAANAQMKAAEEAARRGNMNSQGGVSANISPASPVSIPASTTPIQSFSPTSGQDLAAILAQIARGNK